MVTGTRLSLPFKKLQNSYRGECTMRKLWLTGTIILLAGLSATAQDWYHDREERFRGEEWRPHLFDQVKTDLDHVWADRAADREKARLQKTEEELSKMQVDLDQGRWDNGLLNDVIDSIRKSSDDIRLSQQDRAVLTDDLMRLKEFQDLHNRH
jgi:hypothetical protein